MIAHFADYHVCLVFAGLTLFAYFAEGAVPAESLHEVSLELRLDASAVPKVFACLALNGIVGVGDRSHPLVAALTPVYAVIGLSYNALSLRFLCSHLLRLRCSIAALCRLLWRLLRRYARFDSPNGVLYVLHYLLELCCGIDHPCNQRLAAFCTKTHGLVALHHLKKSIISASVLTLHGCPLFESNICVLQ